VSFSDFVGGEKQGTWEFGPFKASYCACVDDVGGCIKTMICPCLVVGENRSKIFPDKGCFLPGCLCLLPVIGFCCNVMYRGELREKFNIEGSCASDCIYWICGPLALCQETREITIREREASEKGIPFP